MKMRKFVFAAMLAISPLTCAFAQSTGPDVKADSTKESTAIKDGSGANPRQQGSTGSTVVPGDNSSIAGDHKATADTKTGGVAGGK
jgi:hypothetical protein